MMIRVYNYNTGELVHKWEAHTDYIRSLAVHPSLPYLLSTSDDTSIKLWDWDQGWANIRIYEGHTHYVMMVAFNPKDPNTFATASLDRKIKVLPYISHIHENVNEKMRV
jgi:coatomer subunit beta'